MPLKGTALLCLRFVFVPGFCAEDGAPHKAPQCPELSGKAAAAAQDALGAAGAGSGTVPYLLVPSSASSRAVLAAILPGWVLLTSLGLPRSPSPLTPHLAPGLLLVSQGTCLKRGRKESSRRSLPNP